MTHGGAGAIPRNDAKSGSSLWKRLRSRAAARGRRGRLTREGKAFVFLTVGVGVAAVNTGNNLLYLSLGLLLSLLLVSMVLSEVALYGLRIERRLPIRAFVGEKASVELRVCNKKRWMPSYSLEVEDLIDGAATGVRCFFLKVPPQGAERAEYRHEFTRRGRREFRGFQVITRYPFGLVEKAHTHRGRSDLVVYPAVRPGPPLPRFGSAEAAVHPQRRRGSGDEIDGLREHAEGDEARSVHWRRSASLGYLVVRERKRDAARRFTVTLDTARPDGATAAWEHAFERAIESAAGFTQKAAAHGAVVDVVVRGGRSPQLVPGSPCDSIWRYLALLEPSTHATPMASVDRHSLAVPIRLES